MLPYLILILSSAIIITIMVNDILWGKMSNLNKVGHINQSWANSRTFTCTLKAKHYTHAFSFAFF